MNVPTISTRKKRFDPQTGEIVQVDEPSSPVRHPIERLCDSLNVPVKYIGEYVKESREARLLVYCVLLGKKLKILWPKFVENLAFWQFLKDSLQNQSNSLVSLSKEGDYHALVAFLKILKSERELNICKMSFQFTTILKKLKHIQHSLVQYSRSNLGVFEQLKHIQIPNFEELLVGRAKLSDCENSLAKRIEGITCGVMRREVDEEIFLSWSQFFENLKRKRSNSSSSSTQVEKQRKPPNQDMSFTPNPPSKSPQKMVDEEEEKEKENLEDISKGFGKVFEERKEEEEEEEERSPKRRKLTNEQTRKEDEKEETENLDEDDNMDFTPLQPPNTQIFGNWNNNNNNNNQDPKMIDEEDEEDGELKELEMTDGIVKDFLTQAPPGD